jgi:hypothetical protein
MAKRAELRRRNRQKSQQSTLNYFIIGGAVALVLIVLVALVVTRSNSTSTSTASNSTLPNPEIPRIAPAEADAKLGQPGVIFLDARSAQEYNESHITGAINIPLPEIPSRFSELPRDAEIIAYCT